MTDERAVRLALDAGRANLRIAELEDERAGLREYVDRLILAADSRENQIAEAWDEVERLRGELDACQRQHMAQQTSSDYELGQQHAQAAAVAEVERLRGQVERLQVERHDLIERLIQQGGDPT